MDCPRTADDRACRGTGFKTAFRSNKRCFVWNSSRSAGCPTTNGRLLKMSGARPGSATGTLEPSEMPSRTTMTHALHRQRGFTLIEVMITVAIIAILSAIAIPMYRDYVIRARLVDATNGLNMIRADMERHFQDNRTFATVGTRVSPCQRPAAQLTFGKFVVSCSGAPPDPTSYELTATGTGDMSGFSFTVNQADVRRTTTTVTNWTAATPNTCWILKKGQTC